MKKIATILLAGLFLMPAAAVAHSVTVNAGPGLSITYTDYGFYDNCGVFHRADHHHPHGSTYCRACEKEYERYCKASHKSYKKHKKEHKKAEKRWEKENKKHNHSHHGHGNSSYGRPGGR